MSYVQSLQAFRIALPMVQAFSSSQGTVRTRETIIVRLETDEGGVGYGECVAFTEPFYTNETVQTEWDFLTNMVRPFCKNRKVNELLAWLDTYTTEHPMAVAGVENACLHVLSGAYNTVAQAMGQLLESKIPVGVVIGHIPETELLDTVKRYVAEGCRRIKLKVDGPKDYERVAQVRHAFPTLELAVDGNQSFSPTDVDIVTQWDDLQLMCIEEPFHIPGTGSHLERYIQWKHSLSHWPIQTKICFDESILSVADVKRALETQVMDVLNVKIGRLGGLRNAVKAIQLCREYTTPYWIGSMVETGVSKWLHVQLAALGDSYMAGDLSDSSRYFYEDITEPIISHRGMIPVPQGPGLGVFVYEDRWQPYVKEQW